jgi:nucleoside-diphosphate-sugar epimerase
VISILPGANPLLRRVNVEGTRNVLQAALRAGVQKLVYTSSIHAIQRAETGVIDERLPYDPDNPYGDYDRSKAQATLEVRKAAESGLDAVIACPTGVIGPYDFRGSMMGDVIRTIRDSIQWIGHFHTGGNPGRNEIDGTQELNYRAIAQAIADLNFTGYFSHEFTPKRDPLESLRQAVEICTV